MSKLKNVIPILLSILFFSCKTDEVKKDRFSQYQLISTKKETIEIYNIKWAATDRPNYCTKENYFTNENNDSLLKKCFYLDAKNKNVPILSAKSVRDLQNGKSFFVTGKYYKTKKFDNVFPYKEFQLYSFKPKNEYFIVFVYETIN